MKYWQSFFFTIRRETQLGEVWSVPKKRVGVYRNQDILVLAGEGETAVTKEENAELLDYTFQKAHRILYSNIKIKSN